jgi:hypothetical protein
LNFLISSSNRSFKSFKSLFSIFISDKNINLQKEKNESSENNESLINIMEKYADDLDATKKQLEASNNK